MTLSRETLYDSDLSAEDAMLSLLGLTEGFVASDMIEVIEGVLEDSDLGTPVPPGHYVITDSQDNLVHIVQHDLERKVTGGKEYVIHATAMEECVVGGDVKVYQHLGEGRYRNSVNDPRHVYQGLPPQEKQAWGRDKPPVRQTIIQEFPVRQPES